MSDILKKSENDLTKMSETDFNLYQLYAQQIKIRQDVQTYKSNIATENYWTSKIEKFKKNENIDPVYRKNNVNTSWENMHIRSQSFAR